MADRPVRVLLVEDNPGDARFIREMLGEADDAPFAIEEAGDLAAALDRLSRDGLDAVLLDLGLPDSQGLETLLKAHAQARQLPFIVLTGLYDEEVGRKAVHEGAQDYLLKGEIRSTGLARSIQYAIERKRAEEELIRTLGALETKTNELDAFTYSVSHDLKEPLRTIEAFSQFLIEDYAERLDDEGRDYLTKLARASARMKRQIEDLLMFSRVSRPADPPSRVGVRRVAEDVLESMRFAIDEKQAAVRIAGELPDVLADDLRIEQVFGNLIGNALKFNESERPEIEIGVRDAGPASATFYVRDNGIGVDPEYHDRIFGVFQRLHRREAYEGTGAGLAIARKAVESLGGTVWLESRLGHGATFFFTLPLWPETAAPRTSSISGGRS